MSTRLTPAKAGLSLFIVLNLITLLAMNRPDWFATWLSGKVQQGLRPAHAAMLNDVPAGIYWFAHKAGLNVKWQMYSYLLRYDFTILAVGIDAHGKPVLLPEPMQSQRGPLQSFFTDFREAKYQLAIYQWPTERDRYLSYLLRRYRDHNGVPIDAVRLDLQYRNYVDHPQDALATGDYFKGPQAIVPLVPAQQRKP